MSIYWWIGLFQFIACGIFGFLGLMVPKIQHIPSSERIYYLGLSIGFFVLALIGLTFMQVSTH